jgi:membrane protein YdbS with pleckstrin-like domain
MYKAFCDWCERLLRIPPQPDSPPGDESTARVFLASPQYFRYRLALWSLRNGIGMFFAFVSITAAVAAAAHRAWPILVVVGPLIAFVALVRLAFSLAILRLDYEKRWYVVTERSLRIREGIVHVREMTVTFANIQNISVSQGPLQRAFGIADLKVETAGGGGAVRTRQEHTGPNLHTAWFRGIDNAAEIRSLMQERLRRLKDSGLGDTEELLRTPVPTDGSPMPPGLVDALRQVCLEAAALRRAAETATGAG